MKNITDINEEAIKKSYKVNHYFSWAMILFIFLAIAYGFSTKETRAVYLVLAGVMLFIECRNHKRFLFLTLFIHKRIKEATE